MLKAENLTFSYRRKGNPVVSDISLTLEPGCIYGLLGRNGVGKTTLLYLLAGLLTPQRGTVKLNGVNTRHRLPMTLEDIFIVTDEIDLPSVNLSTYVKAVAPFYSRFSKADLKRYLEFFEMDPAVNLGSLSMGQKKKVYISFALACNTSLLLLDEPTNGLDIPGKSAFRKLIAGEMTDDRTVVISTHQVRDIDSMLDHVMVLDDARLTLDASVSEINSRLKFNVTDSADEISKSLYSQPALEGTSVVAVNDDDSDTRINLEALFGLVISKPETIKDLFNPNNSES